MQTQKTAQIDCIVCFNETKNVTNYPSNNSLLIYSTSTSNTFVRHTWVPVKLFALTCYVGRYRCYQEIFSHKTRLFAGNLGLLGHSSAATSVIHKGWQGFSSKHRYRYPGVSRFNSTPIGVRTISLLDVRQSPYPLGNIIHTVSVCVCPFVKAHRWRRILRLFHYSHLDQQKHHQRVLLKQQHFSSGVPRHETALNNSATTTTTGDRSSSVALVMSHLTGSNACQVAFTYWCFTLKRPPTDMSREKR